ncbi:MAG TPA: OmpA family protein, partial [Pyrinomonadaceae bacterium]
AVQGVQVANERINAIDDYTPEQSVNVNFKLRSAALTPEAKTALDQVAAYAKNAKGFLIEVTGYAYESKDKNVNRNLSEQRAESVVRYLVENHNIPIRRILTPFGYGAKNPVADNTPREGRAENRRAEVRVLVNRGLNGTPGDGSKISAATQP